MLEIAQAKPAPLFLDRDPVQPELAHLRPQLDRETVVGVNLGGDRRDLVGREPPRCIADRVGHFAKVEIEAGHVAHQDTPVGLRA